MHILFLRIASFGSYWPDDSNKGLSIHPANYCIVTWALMCGQLITQEYTVSYDLWVEFADMCSLGGKTVEITQFLKFNF